MRFNNKGQVSVARRFISIHKHMSFTIAGIVQNIIYLYYLVIIVMKCRNN